MELILIRLPKYFLGTLSGTLIDTVVLWVFSHFVFHNYVGRLILSPIISFECAVFTNYVVCYFFTWKDRIAQKSKVRFFMRYAAYNVSCTGGFLFKMGFLMLIEYLTKLDVVICNWIALCFSGTYNFIMNEFVIFNKKK